MTLSQDGLDQQQIVIEDERTGLDTATLQKAIANNLFDPQGKSPQTATLNDDYLALAYTIRDRLMPSWLASTQTYLNSDHKLVSYFSAEYLVKQQIDLCLSLFSMLVLVVSKAVYII